MPFSKDRALLAAAHDEIGRELIHCGRIDRLFGLAYAFALHTIQGSRNPALQSNELKILSCKVNFVIRACNIEIGMAFLASSFRMKYKSLCSQ